MTMLMTYIVLITFTLTTALPVRACPNGDHTGEASKVQQGAELRTVATRSPASSEASNTSAGDSASNAAKDSATDSERRAATNDFLKSIETKENLINAIMNSEMSDEAAEAVRTDLEKRLANVGAMPKLSLVDGGLM